MRAFNEQFFKTKYIPYKHIKSYLTSSLGKLLVLFLRVKYEAENVR